MTNKSYFVDKRYCCKPARRVASITGGLAGLVLGATMGAVLGSVPGAFIGIFTLAPIGMASGWMNHGILAACKIR